MKNNDNLNYKKKWVMLIAFCFVFLVVVVGTAFSNVNVRAFAQPPAGMTSHFTLYKNGTVLWQNVTTYSFRTSYNVDNLNLPIPDSGEVTEGYYTDAACTEKFTSFMFDTNMTSFALYWKTVPIVDLPAAPTKFGHSFVGWFYDEAFTRPYVSGDVLTSVTNIYPKFDANVWKVNKYDGDVLLSSVSLAYGSVVDLTILVDPTDQSFMWLYKSAPVYHMTMPNEDVNLVAFHDKKIVKLTLCISGRSDKLSIHNYNDSFELSSSIENDTLRFATWYSNPEFNGPPVTSVVMSCDVTLYGKVDFILYSVKFYVDNTLYNTINVSSVAVLGGV